MIICLDYHLDLVVPLVFLVQVRDSFKRERERKREREKERERKL